MANQNFKVKKGLEVGTALTATSDGLNVTGVITATQFSGDGSGLTGITASGSGVVVQEEGSNIGTAATINFIGSNVTAALSGGIANVTVSAGSGGISNVVEDTTPQLGGNLDLNSKDITGTGNISITGGFNATGVSTFQESVTFQSNASFGDNDNAIFGAGQDLKIYHDGSHSRIVDSGTGSLISQASRFSVHSANDSETMIDAVENSHVKLYHNGNEKLATTSNGVDVTGRLSATGSSGYGLVFNDSVKISLGSNNDFQIYHNGTNSLIDNDTGTLLLRSNEVDKDILLQSDDGSGGVADYIRCDGSAGEVRLYHYGNEKLNTKSDGINVAGEVQCDSLDVDGNADISGTVSFGSTVTFGDHDKIRLGNGQDLNLYHDGSNSYITDTGTGNLLIQGSLVAIQNTSGETIAKFEADGASTLNFDGSGKLVTTNTGVTVTGTVAATAVTGDGSGLTSLTGVSAGTYGASNITPVITVDSNGRITGISTVDTAGGGGGGGGISNLSEDTTPQLGGDLDMNGNDITSNVNIVSTDSGNAAAPELSLYRNSSSPAAADYIGQIKFQGESSSGATRLYAKITGKIGDPTNGSEDGIIEIAHRKNGSNNISARWNQDELQLINGTELSLGDSQKIKIGASDDLQIYHDGTNSYVSDAGTGGLKITGGDVYIRNTSDQDMIHASSGSFVKLYHNNALRLQTTDTGVNITDNLNVAGISTFSGNINSDSDITTTADITSRYLTAQDVFITGVSPEVRFTDTDNNPDWSMRANSGELVIKDYTNSVNKIVFNTSGMVATGVVTATSFSGDGSALTNLPASGMTTSHTNVQATWSVTANGSSAYRFTGPGNDAADNNPDLYLVRGQRYRFINNSGGSHPFQIRSVVGGSAYSAGVTNNGASSGNIEFNVQHDAPSRLFYQCTAHSGMVGNIYITGGGQWENTSVAASGTPEIYTDYNVGIGTDNPGERLHLTTTSGNCKLRIDAASAASVDFYNSGTRFSDMFTDAGTGNFTITNRQNADIIFRTNGTNERVYVKSSGEVSIGGFTPGAGAGILQISGGLRVAGSASASDTTSPYLYRTSGSDHLNIATNGSERLRIDSSGHMRLYSGDLRVGDNTDSNAGSQTISVGSVSSGSGGIGIFANPTNGNSWVQFGDGTSGSDQYRGYMNYQHGDDSLRFGTAASEGLRIDSNGRIATNGRAPSDYNNPDLLISGDNATLTIMGDGSTNNSSIASLKFRVAGTSTGDYTKAAIFAKRMGGYNDLDMIFAMDTAADANGVNLGNEKMRLTSAGRLGINVTSPGCTTGGIHAVHDANQGTPSFTGAEVGIFQRNYNGAQDCAISIVSGTNASSIINFGDKDDVNPGIIEYMNGSNAMRFSTNAAERLRITSDGKVSLGGSFTAGATLHVRDSNGTTQGAAQIKVSKGVGSGAAPASPSRANCYIHLGGSEWGSGANGEYLIGFGYTNGETGTGIPAYIGFKETSTASYTQGDLIFGIRSNTTGTNNPTERVRFRADGTVHVGPSNYSWGTPGVRLSQISDSHFTRSGGNVIAIRRNTNDGSLLDFYQDGTAEGAINVSGSDVTLAGATLSRWTQLPGNAERTEILRGTVLSNLDEMCEWGDENNEQLNRMKVSDVEGDVNVAGVFRCWDDDDDTYLNDYYCAMTGDFVIRIAQGVTVARGDLLMSAGDGTAKPQGDDIVRSKTVAKVTSTTVSATYSDGSYCVPCVLMAC